MNITALVLTVIGLAVFEIVNSVDNAVINADMLGTMNKKSQKWFLLWGIVTSVFMVRGLAPWLIVWLSTPKLNAWQAFQASFSSDPRVSQAMEASAPILLVAAGVFLTMLFLHWLFMEEKHFGLPHEPFFHAHSFWFYAASALFLTAIIWFSVHRTQMLAFASTVGFSMFFIVQGFKENAEAKEEEMLEGKLAMSDISKLLYLEVIDACFSVDGVLGAFAFTLTVPLILIGNGIGAMVVRQITVGNVERVKRLKLLKNGAMYSIGVLGGVMIFESFGHHVPAWVSPVITFIVIGYFFWRSLVLLKKEAQEAPVQTATNLVKAA
jgi:hypothetical protein